MIRNFEVRVQSGKKSAGKAGREGRGPEHFVSMERAKRGSTRREQIGRGGGLKNRKALEKTINLKAIRQRTAKKENRPVRRGKILGQEKGETENMDPSGQVRLGDHRGEILLRC